MDISDFYTHVFQQDKEYYRIKVIKYRENDNCNYKAKSFKNR